MMISDTALMKIIALKDMKHASAERKRSLSRGFQAPVRRIGRALHLRSARLTARGRALLIKETDIKVNDKTRVNWG